MTVPPLRSSAKELMVTMSQSEINIAPSLARGK